MSKKTTNSPMQQGELDSLCGVYCVVNAVRYLLESYSDKQSISLFSDLLYYLEPRANLVDRLTDNGTVLHEISGLLNHIILPRYGIERFKPFHRCAAKNLQGYCDTIDNFLTERYGIVLTAIGG